MLARLLAVTPSMMGGAGAGAGGLPSCMPFLHILFSLEFFSLAITFQGQNFRVFFLSQHNLKGIKIKIPSNRLH